MAAITDTFKGCLLGMAAGDAMGLTVDKKTYEEICADYGPAGLLGYDLVNGFAEISSYTQVAAFSCNGLLLSLSRGQSNYLRNITLALKEWTQVQHLPRDPQRRSCWLSHVPQLRTRKSMDARTLDSFTRDLLGTPEKPANQADGPGTLTAAIPIGLFFSPERMEFHDIGQLGAQTVALTHGDPSTFLCGAVLAYALAGIVQEESSPEENLYNAAQAVQAQFSATWPQATELCKQIHYALELARNPENMHPQIMEQLECITCAQVLAGAAYAVSASHGDFDTAMIIAVNHSGKSAAVGAVTGALLGAALGEEALPEFYLECLEVAPLLRELATDLFNCSPGQLRSRLFDDDFDRKYMQGLPVDREGWAEA